MSVDGELKKGPSSVRSAMCAEKNVSPLWGLKLLVYGVFYKHVAPTALKTSDRRGRHDNRGH